jgi:SAM-dependent methyltransferase
MAKVHEIAYLKSLDQAHLFHAINKPFLDRYCAEYLFELGAILSLLPPPPARLLDLGCGAGWTSVFFSKTGYDVLGVDISKDMISFADQLREREQLDRLRFMECDYEDLPFENEFDCVVFYDSLHHAMDEDLAVRMAFRALKSPGVCVTSEPGKGHHDSPAALEAVRKYQLTEKDMPPARIVALGRKAGFRDFEYFPHARDLHHRIFARTREDPSQFSVGQPGLLKRLGFWVLIKSLGIGSRVFPRPTDELYYFRHLARCFSTVPELGGIVRLVK